MSEFFRERLELIANTTADVVEKSDFLTHHTILLDAGHLRIRLVARVNGMVIDRTRRLSFDEVEFTAWDALIEMPIREMGEELENHCKDAA